MKKEKLLILLAVLLTASFRLMGQESNEEQVIIGKKYHLFSASLNQNREYWVSLPSSYNSRKYAPAAYPVVYLLDGDANFHSFTGIVDFLSKGAYAQVPEMIVVAVLNTDRTRDLTPTKAKRTAFFDKNTALFANSGGNAKFLEFLSKELKPHIDSTFRTQKFNILVGHSFGGLTAINALLNYTTAFNAYIAIDPSVWWDDQVLLRQASKDFPSKNFEKRILYTARARRDVIPQDTSTDMPRSNIRLAQLLETSNNSLRWKAGYYENEDHGTVSIPAAFDALKFIFEGRQVNVKQAVDNPQIVTETYQKLSQKLGVTFLPPEQWLDAIGNYCISINKTDKALAFFDLNVKLYPQSKHVYQAKAEAYHNLGDKQNEQFWLRKALGNTGSKN